MCSLYSDCQSNHPRSGFSLLITNVILHCELIVDTACTICDCRVPHIACPALFNQSTETALTGCHD